MQFTANGPDIPVELLQAHEDGKLVFFCGAGVSYPAGLPGFEELIRKLAKAAHAPLSHEEKKLIKAGQIDQAIGRYENRIQGGRDYIRSNLPAILGPDLDQPHALRTHCALLELGRRKEGPLTLVTTNFDRLFHQAAEHLKQPFLAYEAPRLPVPKNKQWDGLVYLHGLLPENSEKPPDMALAQLVLSSGDFGKAYLLEGWATRFLTELFRHYRVCFVGYSINDALMRYMVDALAADRLQGIDNTLVWVFAAHKKGDKSRQKAQEEWAAKGVTPILYENDSNHSALHETLHQWAAFYRDGMTGKESFVTREAPNVASPEAISRVLWALADPSGLPAKRFAQLNPVPSLEWLSTLFPEQGADKTGHSIPDPRTAPWSPVTIQIRQWLLRHMDDPELLWWLLEQGDQIHQEWRFCIENKLDEYAGLAQEQAQTDERARIKAEAPNAIPNPLMRSLWRLLLGGRLVSIESKSLIRANPDLHGWKKRLNQEGLSSTLRLQLREMLTPQIRLERDLIWNDDAPPVPRNVSELLHRAQMDWELVFAADNVDFALGRRNDPPWATALPYLLDDFQQLLRDTLDILHELGEANSYRCASRRFLPSISPHEQNQYGLGSWGVLIELLRDAWLAVHRLDSARATQIALGWFAQPHLTFQRLALFAASQPGVMAAEQWAQGLLAHEAQSLWSSETTRELMRLLVLQGSQLTGAAQAHLETAIMAGPPREAWSDDMDAAQWQRWNDQDIWLLLAKLESSGLALGAPAAARLVELSTAHPEWHLKPDESNEFADYVRFDTYRNRKDEQHIAPRRRSELVQWLKQPPAAPDWGHQDNWRDVCRTRFFHSLAALADLDCEQTWPVERWQQALGVWSEPNMVLRSWHYAAPLVAKLPDDVLAQVNSNLAYWLDAVTKKRTNEHRAVLLDLCQRILALTPPRDTDSQPNDDWVSRSLNHPVGHVTRALLNLWFKHRADNKEPLADDVLALLSQVCRASTPHFIHGRAMLARYSAELFDATPHWTGQHLLPWFDWAANPVEAQAVWQGFFRSSSGTPSLMLALKPHFLACVQHYDELGNQQQQFVTFLTNLALHLPDVYSQKEWGTAFAALPQEALTQSINCIAYWLGANQAKENYWENRIKPFWKNIYPKAKSKFSSIIADSVAEICIKSESQFPILFKEFEHWLDKKGNQSISQSVLSDLNESGLCQQYPEVTLQFLSKTISTDPLIYTPKYNLKQCLDKIQQTKPELTEHPQFIKLHNYTESS